MVYLSSTTGGEGSGATNFFLSKSDWEEHSLIVTPKRGSAIVFLHRVMHEGAPVVGDAVKYVLRSDAYGFVRFLPNYRVFLLIFLLVPSVRSDVPSRDRRISILSGASSIHIRYTYTLHVPLYMHFARDHDQCPWICRHTIPYVHECHVSGLCMLISIEIAQRAGRARAFVRTRIRM